MTTLPNASPIKPNELMPATSARTHPSECSIGTKKAVRPLTSIPIMTASIAAAPLTANQALDALQSRARLRVCTGLLPRIGEVAVLDRDPRLLRLLLGERALEELA